MDVDVAFLESIPVFGGLTTEAILLVAARMERRTLGPDKVVVNAGDSAREMFIIEDGEVEVMLGRTEPLSDVVLATLRKGDCFGEMALLDIQPRSATVRTRTAASLLVLPYRKFHLLAREEGNLFTMLILNLSREVSRRLREAHRLLLELALERHDLPTQRIFGSPRPE